jgi:N-acetylmuramoyl-L-alanine amidase
MDTKEAFSRAEAWIKKNKRWLVPVAAVGAAGIVGYRLLHQTPEKPTPPPSRAATATTTYLCGATGPRTWRHRPWGYRMDDAREAHLNLEFARYAARYFEQYGVQVEYTRTSDVTVSLTERIAMACSLRPDAFVSIHFNAGPITAHGTEAIISSVKECPTDLSRRLAQRLVDHVAPAVGRGNRGVKTDCQTGQPCPFTIWIDADGAALLKSRVCYSKCRS